MESGQWDFFSQKINGEKKYAGFASKGMEIS